MTTLDRYRASTSEAEMQQAVQDIVDVRGGRLFHVQRSDFAPELADLPDWIVIAPWLGMVGFFEGKSQRRIVTPGQAQVLELLADCTRLESGIVRPNPRPGELSYDTFIEWLKG